MDYKKIDNIKFDGVDLHDIPDMCDAFIQSADYLGEPMSQAQLDEINDDHDFVYEKLMEHIY
jgi:hypothetical protein